MTGTAISPEELHAFIDGELPPGRADAVRAALAADPVLAGQAEAFRRDRERLAAAFAPIAQAPLPDAWRARIEAAVVQPAPLAIRRRITGRTALPWAIAACVALALGLGALRQEFATPDTILAEAWAARRGSAPASLHLTGGTLGTPEVQSAMAAATRLPVRPPDLRKLGWQLAAVDIYREAAGMRYGNKRGQTLTIYVRRSAGPPRFDLLENGATQICIWQDEVVGAVLIGDMSKPQMMRVAGTAYPDLDL
jgi:anti-sigma factor RsiW